MLIDKEPEQVIAVYCQLTNKKNTLKKLRKKWVSLKLGGRNFIIDRTNLTVKSRAKFIQKLKLHNYEIEAVVFPEVGSEALSKEEWKRRLDSRPGKTIPQEVLDQMVDSYEIPLMSEGFSKITVL